ALCRAYAAGPARIGHELYHALRADRRGPSAGHVAKVYDALRGVLHLIENRWAAAQGARPCRMTSRLPGSISCRTTRQATARSAFQSQGDIMPAPSCSTI